LRGEKWKPYPPAAKILTGKIRGRKELSKETFYFPHDYEPTSDPKIQALLGEFGGLGYGVYWRVIEMLHSDESHKLPLKDYIFIALAKQMLTSAEQIKAIITFAITQCELFISDRENVWSKRVNDNFLRRQQISEMRAKSGRLGAEKKWSMASAKQNLAKHGKEKKKKEKEKKENKEIVFPDWLPKETFLEFISMREEKKVPLPEISFNRFFKKLKTLSDETGNTPEEILDQSISCGWQGIFAIKNNTPTKKEAWEV